MRNFDDGIQMYKLEFAVLIFAGTTHTALSLYENYKHVKLKSAKFIVIIGLAGSLAILSPKFQFKMVHNAW